MLQSGKVWINLSGNTVKHKTRFAGSLPANPSILHEDLTPADMNNPALALSIFLLALGPFHLAANEEDISTIRALYAEFENTVPVTKKHLKFGSNSEPVAGTLTTTTYPDELTMVYLTYAPGDHEEVTQTFYFGPHGLFFAYKSSSYWKFATNRQEDGSTTTDTLAETRFYFKDGACIRQLHRSMTVGTRKAGDLPVLIQKAVHQTQKPAGRANEAFHRALALRGITTSREATRFFNDN